MGSTSISVRGLAAIAAVCALACLDAASANASQLAVVGNAASDKVSVVDTARMQIVGNPIDAGNGPASIVITPDGRYAYVADAFGTTVSVIDVATGASESIEVGDGPFGAAITPDGSRAFVTDRSGGEVSVIDTRTKQVVGIHLKNNPTGVAISPGGEFAYVTEAGASAVEVIDTRTMEVVGDAIEGVGAGPVGIEFTPDGTTAYVADRVSNEVSAIDTATRKVTPIELEGEGPRGIVVAPDGRKAFVVELASHSVAVIDTVTNKEIEEIPLAGEPGEVAVAANGETVYVTVTRELPEGPRAEVQRIDVETGTVLQSPVELPGEFADGIALTPDQSPIAAFAVPNITAGLPATFSAKGSTDADGAIASYSWAFGDGGTASGQSPTHTYAAPGTYNAKLSVVDDEGCGEEEVFTGRTAYCRGGASSITRPVTVNKAPVVVEPGPVPPPSNNFHLGRVIHNRHNGTARVQVTVPSAGFLFLFGKKVHAVKRKSKGEQRMWLTLHPRVEVNRRLKKIHRVRVRFRVTFTPDGGTAKTLRRAVTLRRTPRKWRRHGGHAARH